MDSKNHPLGNCNFSKGGLVAGTTTTITTTVALMYSILGKLYTKAALTNEATPTTDVNTGATFVGITANNGTAYILGINAAGAIVAAEASIEALDVQGNFIRAPHLPPLSDTYAPWGMIVVKGASNLSGTWRLGASNLSAVTGMTYSFSDLNTYPHRPVVA